MSGQASNLTCLKLDSRALSSPQPGPTRVFLVWVNGCSILGFWRPNPWGRSGLPSFSHSLDISKHVVPCISKHVVPFKFTQNVTTWPSYHHRPGGSTLASHLDSGGGLLPGFCPSCLLLPPHSPHRSILLFVGIANVCIIIWTYKYHFIFKNAKHKAKSKGLQLM